MWVSQFCGDIKLKIKRIFNNDFTKSDAINTTYISGKKQIINEPKLLSLFSYVLIRPYLSSKQRDLSRLKGKTEGTKCTGVETGKQLHSRAHPGAAQTLSLVVMDFCRSRHFLSFFYQILTVIPKFLYD